MSFKIIFFGSSDFSIPPLEWCTSPQHELAAVVTTPERPKGRGLHLQPNPVMERCQRLGVLTLAPSSLKDPQLKKKIEALTPDLFLVASYGKLIPSSWLSLPRVAAWNVHPSLLPKYRGAAPIPWQILEGDRETGVTLACLTEELDAGDIVHQIRLPLEPDETTQSLTLRLSELAKRVLEEAFQKLEKGAFDRIPQDPASSSYARKLVKKDGFLDLKEPAVNLERKIRAFHPWPGAFISYQRNPLRILQASVESIQCAEAKPGTLLEMGSGGYFRTQTGQGSLKILKVQQPGRRVVSGAEFVNGQRLKPGFVFENLR